MAKLFSTKLHRLPSKATPGDVYFCTDSKDLFLAVGDGSLLNVADLFSGAVPHVRTVGPQGEIGATGAPGPIGLTGQRGERGTDGSPGATGPAGVDGKSITGPMGPRGERGLTGPAGPQGLHGVPGPRGEQGPRAEILYVGPEEMAAEIKKLRAEIVRQRAAILAGLIDRLDGIKNAQVKRHLEIHLQSIQQDFERLSH